MKDELFCSHYDEIIREQEEWGFIEEVSVEELHHEQCHYLAHYGVKEIVKLFLSGSL